MVELQGDGQLAEYLGNLGKLGNLGDLGNQSNLGQLDNLCHLCKQGHLCNQGHLNNLGNQVNQGNQGHLGDLTLQGVIAQDNVSSPAVSPSAQHGLDGGAERQNLHLQLW